ncbi:MAG: helix-hairpin-helix domain-containing protein, partial [Hyphomicrobiales bacterium]|nr:helix-hairpin-helix domain-containing protein [Hyphomicrobiales bacterium]MCY4038281.1 helix-hairpin-helix domain-containing protein [Hyphomicrobiales bacterium]
AEITRRNEEYEAQRKAAGVADALVEIPSVTPRILAAFGAGEVLSVEDLAGCATDDLIGWYENENGERVRRAGILDGIECNREQAEMMIMNARIAAGWIEALPEASEGDGEEGESGESDVVVEDALREISGMSDSMLSALGRGGISSVEDLAGCATDDLMGWDEKNVRQEGIFEGIDITVEAAEALIMEARKAAGWLGEDGPRS